MNPLEQALLNDYQRDFPVDSTPFAHIAKAHNTDTATILQLLAKLKREGSITRVGPVFRPNTIGVSTLAAMKIPENKLEAVAELVNSYPEVNHNYEREHAYNLWFVVTAPDQQHLESILLEIEKSTGIDIMRLPLVKEHHIDLGFKMPLHGKEPSPAVNKRLSTSTTVRHSTQPDDAIQDQLIARIQSGLPLVDQPYAEIAKKLDIDEQEVMRRIEIMLTTGAIRRMGVVVRHHELGYRANAMLVWDIPDQQVNKVGEQLSRVDCITLCYQRPRHLPHWPYNLFTMIHGKDRQSVERCIEEIVQKYGLGDIPRATLFSLRRFKQRGACYSYARPETHFQIASNG
ncbi:MAG TPA: Lrp/AsnC family transcriptional regulator [Gammaproteobacteria bacterium]|nr:Lrp/AsnC family transcriptional regulator [Gammaproteobacteria bacterium]